MLQSLTKKTSSSRDNNLHSFLLSFKDRKKRFTKESIYERPARNLFQRIFEYMNSLHQNADVVLSALPAESSEGLLPAIRTMFLNSQRTLIVLDDDPTGTQTCYDVVVLTSWSVNLLVEELRKHPPILFILTNSRSMPEPLAVKLTTEIGDNLAKAVKESGRDIAVISRSDSTLRGHYP